MVPDPDRHLDRHRLLRGAGRCRPGPRSPALSSWLSLISNLGMLGFFKYFNFFVENVAGRARRRSASTVEPAHARASLLPVGISFYTFQTMSYTIDVYRGELTARAQPASTSPLFVSFFPQLVAGPIERRDAPAAAGRSRRGASRRERRGRGLSLDAAGASSRRSSSPTTSASSPTRSSRWSDPALRAARGPASSRSRSRSTRTSRATPTSRAARRGWLGFELIENFDHPYLATRPAEFWRRWHISLSTWFRDYVYIPLGGSRAARWLVRTRNILVTFLLSGLWHGASWNFVLWGAVSRRAAGSLAQRRRAGRSGRRPRLGPLARWSPQIVGDVRADEHRLAAVPRDRARALSVRDLTLSPFGVSRSTQAGLYLFLLAFRLLAAAVDPQRLGRSRVTRRRWLASAASARVAAPGPRRRRLWARARR